MASGQNPPLNDDFALVSELFLYVGNLDKKVTDKILYELFVKAGSISRINLPKDDTTGDIRGYGFVYYNRNVSALYATELFNGLLLFQKPMRVNLNSKERKSIPYPIIKRIVAENNLPRFVKNPNYKGHNQTEHDVNDHNSSTPYRQMDSMSRYAGNASNTNDDVEPYDPAYPSTEGDRIHKSRRVRHDNVDNRDDETDFDKMLEAADKRHRGHVVEDGLEDSASSKQYHRYRDNYQADEQLDAPSRNYRYDQGPIDRVDIPSDRRGSMRSHADRLRKQGQFYHPHSPDANTGKYYDESHHGEHGQSYHPHSPDRSTREYYDDKYRPHRSIDNHRQRSHDDDRMGARHRGNYDIHDSRSHRPYDRQHYSSDDHYNHFYRDHRNYNDRYPSSYNHDGWNRDRRQDARPDRSYESDLNRTSDRKRFKPYG